MKIKHIIISALSLLLLPLNVSANEVAKSQNFTIVIDPGHGGKDFGAIDNGVREKDINLNVAKKLASMLKKKMKDVNVIMTREDDHFISLQERANIANKNKGNLFISIHTNSVDKSNPRRKTVSGTSVYALGLHKDQNNLKVARRENAVIELESNYKQKYSGFDPNKDESYIIFEMAQKKNLGQSLKFADFAQKELVSTAGRENRGVKQAGFWVLWATSMPAVLVELDFICNPQSAKFMGSASGEDKFAKSLFNAVSNYIEHYGGKDLAIKFQKNEEQKKNVEKKEGTPILASVEKKTVRNDNAPEMNTSRRTSYLTKRRRRSIQDKAKSATRNVETTDIAIHRENDRLAVAEVVEPEPDEEILAEQTAPTVAKKKKAKKEKKSKEPKSGSKRVVINKDGSMSLTDATGTFGVKVKEHKAVSGYHAKVEKLVTVYKIQILASNDLLKQDNPRFCGLTPVRSFKENGIYKYTYGESRNRAEIEKLLREVKEKIPDAFIISSKK